MAWVAKVQPIESDGGGSRWVLEARAWSIPEGPAVAGYMQVPQDLVTGGVAGKRVRHIRGAAHQFRLVLLIAHDTSQVQMESYLLAMQGYPCKVWIKEEPDGSYIGSFTGLRKFYCDRARIISRGGAWHGYGGSATYTTTVELVLSWTGE